LTPLQLAAWDRPFLSGEALLLPPRIEQPRKHWRVGLSLNL